MPRRAYSTTFDDGLAGLAVWEHLQAATRPIAVKEVVEALGYYQSKTYRAK